MFGVRGDFVVVFVVAIATAVVVIIVLVVDVLVVAIVVDIVDVDGALLLITTLSDIDGTFAIEMLTSLKRFKWKSNCASAGKKKKKTIQLLKFIFAKEFMVNTMWKVGLTNTCI